MVTMKKKSVEIMQDKGPWNFTEEQIHEIQNEDVIAITKFYNDNLNVILAMAKRFVNRKKRLGDYFYSVEDLMQQVFVDIPHYNFQVVLVFILILSKVLLSVVMRVVFCHRRKSICPIQCFLHLMRYYVMTRIQVVLLIFSWLKIFLTLWKKSENAKRRTKK